MNDAQCWRDALTAAKNPITYEFGVVQATANKRYNIDSPIVLDTATGGIIEGNGASLDWSGSYTPMGAPGAGNTAYGSIFVFSDTAQLVLKNIRLTSTPAHRLWAAIEFNNGLSADRDGTLNIVENVTIDGTNTSGLDYGIIFAMRYSAVGGAFDQMNDQSTIRNTTVQNVMKAAISIEGQNSKHHRFMNVNSRAADNNGDFDSDDSDPIGPTPIKGAAFVRLLSGSFHSIGGYHGGFRNSEFFIWSSSDPTTIIDSNSEGCAHFLRTPDGNASHLLPVSVFGGRFDISEYTGPPLFPGLAVDGRIVAWHRYGPLTINGLMVSGAAPSNLTAEPHFYLNPNAAGVGDNQPIPFDISYISTTGPGSVDWDLFVINANVRLTTRGNMCWTSNPLLGARPCGQIAAGTDHIQEAFKNKDLTDASNVFPASLATDTGADIFTNKNLTDASNTFPSSLATDAGADVFSNKNLTDASNTFPSSLATDAGAETFTSKNLTAPSNSFPTTSLIGFTWASATGSPHFCAPASSACHQSANDATIRMPVPTLDATRIECRATANPGGAGKSWTYTVLKNGSATTLTCGISGSSTTCGLTPGSPVAFASGDQMSLQIVRGGSASNGVSTACTVWETPNAP